jgi:aspartate racemase
VALTVGVIGGMGPEATFDFARRLVAATPAERDQEHLHVIVDCDPSVPDRSDAIIAGGEDPSPWLAAMARRLQVAGAELLVMPCNSAHYFAAAITSSVSIPLVDWPGVAAEAARAAGARRVGLLATAGTVECKIYHAALKERQLVAMAPGAAEQQGLTHAIKAVKREGSNPLALRLTREAVAKLAEAGADYILLACTELSTLSSAPGGLGQGALVRDAADIVARHVVARAIAA